MVGAVLQIVFAIVFNVPVVRGLVFTVVPALLLLWYVRKKDMLEPEPPKLVWSLFGLGALSVALAYVLELGLTVLALTGLDEDSLAFELINWFLIVGLTEEGCKYLMLHLRSWKNPNFNCLYDGMVYAVASSAGFALAENFIYLFRYGVSAMFLRAIISVPSHICFAVFMGTFYSSAKKHQHWGEKGRMRRDLFLALLVPTLAHGLYDFIASGAGGTLGFGVVVVFAAAMFVVCWLLIKRLAENDTFIEITKTMRDQQNAESRAAVEDKMR